MIEELSGELSGPHHQQPFELASSVSRWVDRHTRQGRTPAELAELALHAAPSQQLTAMAAALILLDAGRYARRNLLERLDDNELGVLISAVGSHAAIRGRFTGAHHATLHQLYSVAYEQLNDDSELRDIDERLDRIDRHIHQLTRAEAIVADKFDCHTTLLDRMCAKHSMLELVNIGAVPASELNLDEARQLAAQVAASHKCIAGGRDLAERYADQLTVSEWAALWVTVHIGIADLSAYRTHPRRQELIAATWGPATTAVGVTVRDIRAALLTQLAHDSSGDDAELWQTVHSSWLRHLDDRGAQLLDIDDDRTLWAELVNQIDGPASDIVDIFQRIGS